MRYHHCTRWSAWFLLLLPILELQQLSSTSTASRIRDEDSEKAIETQQDRQVEDSEQLKSKWKRWLKRLLLQDQLQNRGFVDGILPMAWKRSGHAKGKMTDKALMYLENDARRARTFSFEPLEGGETGLLAPFQQEVQDVVAGMILQVDYIPKNDNSLSWFHERLQVPVCKDIEAASMTLYAIDTYQLLEPLQLELGLATKHAIDYVYKPVDVATNSRYQQYHPEYYSTTALVEETAQYHDAMAYHQPWWKWWFPFGGRDSFWKGPDEEYKMGDSAFAGGSHGEVWRGRRLCREENKRRMGTDSQRESCKENQSLIFKRLRVEHGYRLLEAGLREVYIGQLLAEDEFSRGLFTTYVNHFFREVPRQSTTYSWTGGEKDLELWIVFEDAGPSLRSYLYSPMSSGDFVVYQHSYFWTLLRKNATAGSRSRAQVDPDFDFDFDSIDEDKSVSRLFGNEDVSGSNIREEQASGMRTVDGKELLKEVLRQILTSAAYLHDHGIVHRDIKPSNCMCKSNLNLDTLQIKSDSGNATVIVKCVLGDFSSAWNKYTDDNLYTGGPSIEELTIEYAPPEALLGPPWNSFSKKRPQSYDSWSIGVLALELLLGSPNVFSVDQRTTVVLTNKMQKQGASEKEIQTALYLAALSQFCIYTPLSDGVKQKPSWPLRHGDPLYKIAMAKQSCTLRDFHQALRARDPLGLGFDQSTDQLLHLIWQLLAWDPVKRISAADALKHPYFAGNSTGSLVAGEHNALESQMLDPRMDFNLSDNVDEFVCPNCGRVFSDWQSCHRHANGRKHAKFCTYDRRKLPSSVSAHSMLPAHPKSGYFDIQGRRPTIEDFHSIHLLPSIQFYGVFDGHTGNLASKFAASTLYAQLTNRLSSLDQEVVASPATWKKNIQQNITNAFLDIHQQFLKAVAAAGHGAMDQSGTTATAVYVTDEAVVVASLGDSRAVLSSAVKTEVKGSGSFEMSAIQLTKDHVASDPDEEMLVQSKGGEVSTVSGCPRVNGVLAITRTLGDAALAPFLSRTPHVVAMTRQEIMELCGASQTTKPPCFIILATDGLWDKVSNQEAIDMAAETIFSYQNKTRINDGGAYQAASEALTLEAYVRGSTDNIGVCIIALD